MLILWYNDNVMLYKETKTEIMLSTKEKTIPVKIFSYINVYNYIQNMFICFSHNFLQKKLKNYI